MPAIDDEGRRIDTTDSTDATDTTTGSTDPTGGTGEVEPFDVSGLPFRFNPPLHKDLRFVRTNLGESGSRSTNDWYDDAKNQYEASFAVRTDSEKTGFEKLRLGRIIMDDMAVSRGVVEGGLRYGFRFLYNPTQLSGSLNVGTDFIPDQRSTATFVLQKGIEQITLELLLNRIPDVVSGAKKGDYLPEIAADDLKRIKEQGTHYDLDFLYRCSSGIHNTRQRLQTGDIGVLLPNPCRLILGPFTSRGALVSVGVTDEMFSGNMVPILSRVNITFSRFLNMAQTDMDQISSWGITTGEDESDDGSGDGDGDGGGGGDTGGTIPKHGKSPTYPISLSGVSGTSAYGHEVHAAGVAACPWMDRRGAVGTYGGSGNHGTGRALDWMMESVNPKTSAHKGWELAKFFKNHANALSITQIIWQQQIWTTERRGDGWRRMANRGSDNTNHYNHVHVSFGPGSGQNDSSKKLTLTTSYQYWK